MTPFIVGDGTRVTVLVDAENVRRSRWPNLSREELVECSRAWLRRRAGREAERIVGGGAFLGHLLP
jgi:hypothetical protein